MGTPVNTDGVQQAAGGKPGPRVVVATTVMLTFISFWRAAAIVLNDLASSAFYAAGIAEQAYGKAAPWFILAVMLFANCVRMVYIESCSMFTRGGVYRTVKEAMGSKIAKISVSALMFDYVLTGPISAVSAGHYLIGVMNDLMGYAGVVHPLPRGLGSAIFAVLVTAYFWRKNIIGIHESSEKSLRIMYVVTVLVVMELAWCGVTLALHGPAQSIAWPILKNIDFNTTNPDNALGWLRGSPLANFGVLAALIAFGHSVLAMSGEESLAQVNREIAHPKLKNLKRAGLVIGVYTFVFTAGSAFLASVLIPDADRVSKYGDNLISGLAMNVAGPFQARLLFQVFVVVVGTIILSGAVNTAIIGSNGVLNRLAEDGVLTDWFRRPHRRFGTTYRLINMVALLQVFTIVISRGNVYLLGEAYAFGVITSFTLMTLSTTVLRFKDPRPRQWRVPGNLRVGRYEIPVTMILIFLVLLFTALTNLFTKKIATISGVMFTGVLFLVFTVSEKVTARRRAAAAAGIEQFNLHANEQVSPELIGCRPGNVLVAVRNPESLEHLLAVLRRTNTAQQDIVVMTTRLIHGPDFAEQLAGEQNVLNEYEQKLFSVVVNLAEKEGKPVSLTVVPGIQPEDAIMMAAHRLRSSAVVVRRSSSTTAQQKGLLLGRSWEKLPQPRPHFKLEVIGPDGSTQAFPMGPHAPSLRPQDVEMLHRVWLELTSMPGLNTLHHDQILTVALRRMAADMRSLDRDRREDIIAELRRMTGAPPESWHSSRTSSTGGSPGS